MKAFVLSVVAMVVIAFGASFTLNSAVDQTVGAKYSVGDAPVN